MDAVFAATLACTTIAIVMGLGFAWLRAISGARYLRDWSTGWLLCALGVTLAGGHLSFEDNVLTPLGPPLMALSALYLVRGAHSFVGREASRGWAWGFGGVAVAISVATLAHVPFVAIAVPANLCTFTAMLTVGIVLLRHRPRRAGEWLAGIGHLALGLHTLTYPICLAYPFLMPWGFLVAAMFQGVIGSGLLMLHHDETLRQLRESEARYRDLYENALVGVFQTKADGSFVRGNHALAEMLGFDSAAAFSAKANLFQLLVDPDSWRTRLRPDRTHQFEGEEIAWRRADGREIVTVVHARSSGTDAGPWSYEGVVQDVTEARSLRNELTEVRRLEAVGSLAAGVAHDFNNLLTVVRAHAELARVDRGDPAVRNESLDAIAGAADQAERLTRQLMAFGRRAVLHPTELDLAVVLGEVAAVFRRVIPETIDFVVEHPATVPVVADRSSIEQLINNLLTNARDAMPEGGQLSVRLSVTDAPPLASMSGDRCEVHLRIRDDGEGMDEHTRDKMFEPFFSTRPAGRGTGLGLATVHGIVAQLRGHLEVESARGKGTTISVALPMQRAARAVAPPRAEATPATGGLRVLVVEDQPGVRRLTVTVLKTAGHQVTAAEHGGEALEAIERAQAAFDVIVSDVLMPVLGGIELTERLREDGDLVPVLLTSGYAAALDGGKALPAATRLLPKPFTPDQLRVAVDDLVAAHRSVPAAPR